MTDISEERKLFRDAADLAIRLQNDSENPVSIETVRAWVRRSPSHEAAWAKVAAIHGMTGQVIADRKQAAQRAANAPTRRNVMIGGAVGLGAIASTSWMAPKVALYAQADHLTRSAEIKHVTLPDNSTVTLGPVSAIDLDFRADIRRVALLSGMAYFDIDDRDKRPFVVASQGVSIAPNGELDVSDDAGLVSISVGRGVADVRIPVGSGDGEQRLNVGDGLIFDTASRGIDRLIGNPNDIAAWRTGRIIADNETVSALVAKIARWQTDKVIFASASLGRRSVSGVFDLSDPARAIDAVVRPFGGRVRKITPFLMVITSA